MSRPRRLPGVSYRGPARYFLTFCTRDRRPYFREPAIATLVIEQFLRTSRDWQFALLAYCLMPDHAHLLIEATHDTSDLRLFAKRAKQGSGQVFAHRVGGPLWQEGYYEHVLRADEVTRSVARYIVENPVRAGLVSRPRDYPHIGSGVWTLDELFNGLW